MDFALLYRHSTNRDLTRLAQHCEALAGEGEMPRWHDFRPNDVSWMLGRIYLVDVIDGGADYAFRLSGMLMKEIYGVDLYGRRLSELEDDGFKRALRGNYDTVIATRKPLYRRCLLRWPQNREINVERLLIPFCDDEGTPAIILGAVHCDAPLEIVALYRGSGPVELVQVPLAEPADAEVN